VQRRGEQLASYGVVHGCDCPNISLRRPDRNLYKYLDRVLDGGGAIHGLKSN
jgi:hypothetical protein